MKSLFCSGLFALIGVFIATAGMAHHVDFDVMDEMQADVGLYELSMTFDDAELMMPIVYLDDVDVLPDDQIGGADVFQIASLMSTMATRGDASPTLVDDAMRLWRVRSIDAFTVSHDLLI